MGASAKTDRAHLVVKDDEDTRQAAWTASLRRWIEPADYRSSGKEPVREERIQNVEDGESGRPDLHHS